MSEFSNHLVEQECLENYTKFDYSKLQAEDTKIVIENLIEIDKEIQKISQGKISETEVPISLAELNTESVEDGVDFYVDDYFLNNEIPVDYQNLIYLILQVKYILHRVCLTYVTVNSESYAFDMFEALNTTGEPLTSFETFRPKVIEFTNKVNNSVSEENEDLEAIAEYLEQFEKAELKHKHTTRMMLSFAQLYNGTKLSRHLSSQRSFLLKEFNKCEDKNKNAFVNSMKSVADTIFACWDNQTLRQLGIADDENGTTELALSVLSAANHEVVISSIAFFVNRFRELDTDSLEVNEAIKSICAFFALWRTYTGGTSGIDQVYRRLHQKGCPEVGLEPLQLANIHKVDISGFKQALKHELTKKN